MLRAFLLCSLNLVTVIGKVDLVPNKDQSKNQSRRSESSDGEDRESQSRPEIKDEGRRWKLVELLMGPSRGRLPQVSQGSNESET